MLECIVACSVKKRNNIHLTGQKFRVGNIFYIVERSLLSPSLMHLFDDKFNKSSTIVKYYCSTI